VPTDRRGDATEPAAEAPVEDGPDGPRWGGGDVAVGLAVGIAGSIVTTVAVLALSGHAPWTPAPGTRVGLAVGQRLTGSEPTAYETLANLPITWQVLTQAGLWAGLLGVTVWAVRTKGTDLRKDLGLAMTAADVPVGLVVGAALQLVMVPLVYAPLVWVVGEQDASAPARALAVRAEGPLGVVVLTALVGVAAPFVEEVFYRGLAQRSFQRRLGATWGIVAAALLFAAMHLQSLQFLPLLVVGLVCGVLAQRAGRLGPAIWTHVGFNLVTVVVLATQLDLV
jgi:membrane protease YdiL (CAAX protease family)